MLVRFLSASALLLASPAIAQTGPDQPSTASNAAKKFRLDPSVLQGEDDVAAPAPPAEGPSQTPTDDAAVAAEPAPVPPPPRTLASARAPLSIDTSIAALIADPHGKAVLDRDLPGLSTDENLDKFSAKSLRQFQPLTGGQMTDAMLDKVAADLAGSATPIVKRRTER